MDAQDAIDSPRFHHDQLSNVVAFEEPITLQVKTELNRLGHNVRDSVGANFGGGQIISISEDGCFIGGSDPRKDGQAQGF